MDFFRLLAIPHSEPTLKLLEFLLFLAFSIYFIYWTFYFGSFFSAFYYAVKAYNLRNSNYLEVSNKYLKYLTTGLVAPFGLAIFPFLAFVLILIQFYPFNNQHQLLTLFFIINFFLLVFSLFITRIFKAFVKDLDKLSKGKILTFGILSLMFIFATIWFSISIYSSYLNPLTDSFAKSFFSFFTIIRLIFFIFSGFVLGLFAYLFFIVPITKKSQIVPEIRSVIQKNVGRGISFGIFLPFLLLLSYISAPSNSVSFQYYLLTIFSVIILFIALVLSYTSFTRLNIRIIRISFYILVISLSVFVGSETSLFAIATKKQKFDINLEYQKFHEQLLASAGRNVNRVNGEEIYKAKCTACHKFETKLVGPPHKEILLKYKDRPKDMVKFILNPVKVNPDYPPMPAQGLKPNEAEAVVKYMFEHYGPMLK